jgi:uncharacterized protein YbcI
MNGEKMSYSACENQVKTKDTTGGVNLIFRNSKYPILNQDTEGFEIGDNSQIEKVNNNILKNMGDNFKERLHVVILLFKNDRGLDNNDIALMVKLQEMKILYYAIYPRADGKDTIYRRKAKGMINSLITKLKSNNIDQNINNLFSEFKDKNELIETLNLILTKSEKIIFSANILSKESKGKINLFNKIKDDLNEIYKIHQEYIDTIDQANTNKEKVIFGGDGKIVKIEDNTNYCKILDGSPFFFNYSIEDIKRKEAEKLLENCDVSAAWLFFYNSRVESFRKQILEEIKKIYSEVNVETDIDFKIFDNNESWFYKTKIQKNLL